MKLRGMEVKKELIIQSIAMRITLTDLWTTSDVHSVPG